MSSPAYRIARREFPAKVKVAAFQRAAGRCEGERDGEQCGGKLTVGKYHYDHRIADGLTGEPTLSNCVVLCLGCHAEKTTTQDVPAIAKAKRREAAHLGAKSKSRYRWPKRSFSRWSPSP